MRIHRVGVAEVNENAIRARPEFSGMVVIDVGIRFPQVAVNGNPAAGVRINAYYMEAAQRYYATVCTTLYRSAVAQLGEEQRNGTPFRPYAAATGYTVPYNRNGFLSIFTDTYEFTGGAHGNTVRRADTWDLSTGRRVPIQALFEGPGYRRIILRSVNAQIQAQLDQGSGSYLDGWPSGVSRYFDERNYYLTPEGLAVYYPLYTIAPYVSGMPTFVVPYREFGSLLRFGL